MDVLAMFVLPAIAGVAIGILSGLLGIGGGTVMVPIFRLAFGMSPVVSTATSLFAIIPTSISGAASHIRHKTCIVSLGVAAGLGGALTSPLGVWLAQISPAWMIMVAAALIIGWSAVKMLGKAFKMRSQNRTQQHAASNSTIGVDEAAIERAGDAAANDDAIDDPTKASAQAGVAVDPAPRKLTRKQLL
ncbi:MAG: sulfite exporter TauE/SafE family protein, partial [Eggerthella lenta]